MYMCARTCRVRCSKYIIDFTDGVVRYEEDGGMLRDDTGRWRVCVRER